MLNPNPYNHYFSYKQHFSKQVTFENITSCSGVGGVEGTISRVRFTGGVQGVHPPPPDDLWLSMISSILPKKKHEMRLKSFHSGAPLRRKILDLPLIRHVKKNVSIHPVPKWQSFCLIFT